MTIPKIIHYCWFGGNPKNELAQRCIGSWKKFCPEYAIVEWNEDNFDVNCNIYCSVMNAQRRWAFLSDYARLKIVYLHGGIYLDTDVELLKPLDDLLFDDAFFALEENRFINTGLGFGATPGNHIINENMNYYDALSIPIKPVKCPDITTSIFAKYNIPFSNKITRVGSMVIYPSEYFSPKDYYTEKITLTDNTYSIHHFSKSWCEKETSKQRFLRMHPLINTVYHIPNKVGMLILGRRYDTLKKILKGK